MAAGSWSESLGDWAAPWLTLFSLTGSEQVRLEMHCGRLRGPSSGQGPLGAAVLLGPVSTCRVLLSPRCLPGAQQSGFTQPDFAALASPPVRALLLCVLSAALSDVPNALLGVLWAFQVSLDPPSSQQLSLVWR